MAETPSSHEPTNAGIQPFVVGMDPAVVNRITRNLGSSDRVQFWSTFESTANIPFPSIATERITDDISAVLAGSKPATILNSREFNDPSVEKLITDEKDRFELLSRGQVIGYYGDHVYFWGKEENVRTLAELYQGRGGNDSPLPADENFHRAVGEALGFPTEAVDAFIARIGRLEEPARQRGRFGRFLGKLSVKR